MNETLTPTKISDHLKPKTIIISGIIAVTAMIIVYASYNFYLSLNRYQTQTLLIRAEEAEKDQKYAEALELRKQNLALDPDNQTNHFGIASLYYVMGDMEKAVESLRAYQEFYGPSNEAELLLGKIYLQQGDLGNSQDALENILARDPKNTEANFYLTLILLANQDESADERMQNFADDTNISQSEIFYPLWVEATQTNNKQYRNSLLAYAFLEISQPHLALKIIGTVIETVPDYRDAHYLQGVAYFQLKEYDKAKESAERALALDADHAASKELITAISDQIPTE